MTTRSRRELGLACLLTLLGAVVALIAARQRWLGSSTGEQIVPQVRALALVALAGVVAVLAARGWARAAVGIALTLGGVAIVVSAAGEVGAVATPAWPVVTAGAGLCVLGAGLLTAVRARSWPTLGARYDAPAAPRSATTGDTWDAIDRGEDPTDR